MSTSNQKGGQGGIQKAWVEFSFASFLNVVYRHRYWVIAVGIVVPALLGIYLIKSAVPSYRAVFSFSGLVKSDAVLESFEEILSVRGKEIGLSSVRVLGLPRPKPRQVAEYHIIRVTAETNRAELLSGSDRFVNRVFYPSVQEQYFRKALRDLDQRLSQTNDQLRSRLVEKEARLKLVKAEWAALGKLKAVKGSGSSVTVMQTSEAKKSRLDQQLDHDRWRFMLPLSQQRLALQSEQAHLEVLLIHWGHLLVQNEGIQDSIAEIYRGNKLSQKGVARVIKPLLNKPEGAYFSDGFLSGWQRQFMMVGSVPSPTRIASKVYVKVLLVFALCLLFSLVTSLCFDSVRRVRHQIFAPLSA